MTVPSPSPVADATDTAYRAILELILSGEVSGGERLREQELALRSGVSRTPVRQALSRLASEGMVKMSRNRGAQVREVTAQDSLDLLAVRAEFEPMATRLSVPRLTPEDLDSLGDLTERMESLAAQSTFRPTELGELNLAFHAILTQNCGNRFLVTSLQSASRPAMVARAFRSYSPASLQRSMRHHAEILEAARVGDAQWAESAMRTHILSARHAYFPGTSAGHPASTEIHDGQENS